MNDLDSYLGGKCLRHDFMETFLNPVSQYNDEIA